MREGETSRLVKLLGYAGLVPQIGFLAAAAFVPPLIPAAAILGWVYAGLIFSFLGGAWWGFALLDARAPRWVVPVSVLPSLIGLLSAVPVVLGWPGLAVPSVIVAIGLLSSPFVDTVIARAIELPSGWLRLRWHLSIGLGLLTLALAFSV